MKSAINNLNDSPFTTILLGIAFIIIVIVGGIVCIVGDDFSFQDYATSVAITAGALGLLGIGRGINSGQKHVAEAETVKAAYESGIEYEESPEAPTEEELEQLGAGPFEEDPSSDPSPAARRRQS